MSGPEEELKDNGYNKFDRPARPNKRPEAHLPMGKGAGSGGLGLL